MCVVRAAVNQKVRLATITSARPAPQDAGKDQTLAARQRKVLEQPGYALVED